MNTINKWIGFQMTLGGIKMKVRELINILKKYELNKDLVIYSNETKLKNYDFQGSYENDGQVELYINEGEKI